MRLLGFGAPGVSLGVGSAVFDRLVPIVNRSAVQVLEKKEPPFLPMADIAPETIIYVTEIETSISTKNPTKEIHLKDRVRVGSAEYIEEVAKKLSDAKALLRAEKYIKISQHIETYIAYISTFDPQYALVSLQQLRERLDIFAKQNTPEKLKSTTTLYSPPSDQVYTWFRESPYKTKQSECIKALHVRSQVKVLSGHAGSMISAISKIAESSATIQLEIDNAKKSLSRISKSVSMEEIYKENFGTLDSNIVWLLYQWEILDPRLHPMLAEYFARKKQAPKISETLKELLYMNLIHRRRTPNTELVK